VAKPARHKRFGVSVPIRSAGGPPAAHDPLTALSLPGGFLVTSAMVLMIGLLVALVGVVGFVRGRIMRLRIRSRTGAALVAAAGMVLALAAGASSPTAPDAQAAASGDDAAAATASASSGRSAPSVTAGSRTPTPSTSPEPRQAAPSASATRPATSTPATTPRATSTPATGTPANRTAAALLDTLPVKGRAPRTGYDRERFGQAWADTDRNGCDTRNDVLRRDLQAIVIRAGTRGCVVLSGTLADPYTGTAIAFARGAATSSRVQIDHVVALSDAWQKGAQQWSAQTRTRFANDPLNLLAVDGPTNQRKSDGDAATWLPPRTSYRCAYVARQTAVKARYGVWMTAAEKDAVRRVLATCPGQRVPTASASVPLGGGRTATTAPRLTSHAPAAAAAPTTRPKPLPAPASGLDPRFATCRAANAGGYGPYRSGADAEYAWYRDRDPRRPRLRAVTHGYPAP
jgi:uncharacterized protein DUF1524